MRIGAYTNSNIYTQQKKSNYSKNSFMNPKKYNESNIAFGGYLDDKLSKLERKLSETRQEVQDDAKYYDKKKKKNNRKISELDDGIEQKQAANQALSVEIKKVAQVKIEKDAEIASLEEKNQELDKVLNETKKEGSNLKAKKIIFYEGLNKAVKKQKFNANNKLNKQQLEHMKLFVRKYKPF